MINTLSIKKTKSDRFIDPVMNWFFSHKLLLLWIVVALLGYHVVATSLREDTRFMNAYGHRGNGNFVVECGGPFSVCLFSEEKMPGRYFGNTYLPPSGIYLFRKETLLGFFFGIHAKGDVDYWTKYDQTTPDKFIVRRWWRNGFVGSLHAVSPVSVSGNLFPELSR